MNRPQLSGWRQCLRLAPVLTLLLSFGQAMAEEREPELSPELKEVLAKVDEANGKLKDMTARVTYERAIPLLEEKEKTTGKLVFKKPDRIYLELGKPRNEEVYTNGKTWWVVDHNDKEVEIYEASEEASREAAFLQFGYGEGSKALLKDYRVELVAKKEKQEDDEKVVLYRLRFVPREKKGEERPARYAVIEVELSNKRWLPHLLVLHEGGDESRIVHTYELSAIKLNTDVDDRVFERKPPGGYAVFRPGEP